MEKDDFIWGIDEDELNRAARIVESRRRWIQDKDSFRDDSQGWDAESTGAYDCDMDWG